MKPKDIELVDQVNELTADEKTTLFIDVDNGVELTTRVAS
jgi:hypothetical protein